MDSIFVAVVILVYIISSIIAFISLLGYQFIAQRLAGSALCVSLLICFLIMIRIINKYLSGENNAQSSKKAAIAGIVAFILLLDIFFLAKSVVMKQSDAAKLFCFGYNTGSTGYFGTIYGIRVVCAIFFACIVYLLLNNKIKPGDRVLEGIATLWGILSIVTMILTSLADIPEIATDDSIKYCKSKADSWGLSTEVFDDI